ncbi:MAG: FkbM family methyltransferase [Anaerolinea sp.]
MNIIVRKLKTLRKLVTQRGLHGTYRYLAFETDNLYVGAVAVLRGNRVQIDGCLIDIDNPLIPLVRKSQFIQGRFEQPERSAIKRFLNPDKPVVELGGSVGVIACITNRLLKNPENHVVVEAHPLFVDTLRKNKALNKCQFTILQGAIAYHAPKVLFGAKDFGSSFYLHSESAVEVETLSLSEAAFHLGEASFQLICDIEGAEVDLVSHELELIRKRVSLMIVEMHPRVVGDAQITALVDRLKAAGFEIVHHEAEVYVWENQALLA